MAKIERFEDIEARQSARKLRQSVYRLTRAKPFAADPSLVDQIRRAAVSGTSNTAEGFARGGNRELIQFPSLAKGSVAEVKDQLYCALDENYISREQFEDFRIAESTSRLIGGFMSYLRNSEISGHKFATPSARLNSKPKTQTPKPPL